MDQNWLREEGTVTSVFFWHLPPILYPSRPSSGILIPLKDQQTILPFTASGRITAMELTHSTVHQLLVFQNTLGPKSNASLERPIQSSLSTWRSTTRTLVEMIQASGTTNKQSTQLVSRRECRRKKEEGVRSVWLPILPSLPFPSFPFASLRSAWEENVNTLWSTDISLKTTKQWLATSLR